jgi:outer membrane lipoprotein-sorting protein
MKRLFLFTLLGLLPLSTTAVTEAELHQAIANASNAEEKGLAIAKMADYRDTGWIDSEAQLLMTLRNRRKDETERELRVKTMEVEGDGDKGMSIFETPPDVKGTIVLTWSHATIADHQWIYLPAMKRVKRISSRNKSGPFMGSEFAYEDIASQEVDKYTYLYLEDDFYKGMDCYKVERYPTYKHSGYTRQVVWIDKAHFNFHKIIFYDRKDAKLKRLTSEDYKQYLGKYWRADKMRMRNYQTGKRTTLDWSDYQFGKGFTDRDFTKDALERMR